MTTLLPKSIRPQNVKGINMTVTIPDDFSTFEDNVNNAQALTMLRY
jgi:hypothetical protein